MRYVKSFLKIFAIVAFVITCNFRLFLHFVPLDTERLFFAATITFLNVFGMTLVFFLIAVYLQYHKVEVPVKRINEAIDCIIAGDFSVQIAQSAGGKHKNEFHRIIEGLNQMTKELGSVETLRTDFVSIVSHEMKTPLSVIQNYCTLLQTPDISEEKRIEYVRSIMMQTRKLSYLTSNVLQLSKLENQYVHPKKETYNLGEQLCECMLFFENEWETKGIHIETDIAENIMVHEDADMLSEVWTNLLSNAVKYTESGGSISLGLKEGEEKIIVTIKDTGCGMSGETIKNMYQKFYQGDLSHGTPGNGLGLSIVKSIMNACGGEIYVTSKVGEGTTFTVMLNKEMK